MITKREIWNYDKTTDVWIGKYLNSHNLPHWHSDCELLFVENGSLDVVCENKNYALEQGDTFFIDTEQAHFMRAKEKNTRLIVIIFNFKIIKKFAERITLSSPKLFEKYDVAGLYEELKKELNAKQPFYSDVIKNKIAKLYIDMLRREKTEQRKSNSSNRLKELLEKINNEYDTITFEDAYKFAAMDEAYFCRYFKRSTGMSFTKYVNHIKIDNAIRLMRQDDTRPVTEVAFLSGFGSIRNFNKTFKEATGYSPKLLPKDFVLTERAFHTDNEFNPTLQDCILIEQF